MGPIAQTGPETYEVQDLSKPGVTQRAITFDGFKQTKFDLILSSIPQHFQPFERLRTCFQPHAKHIFYAGNAHWPLPSNVQNLMANTLPLGGENVHHVVCHQEFDLSVFKYKPYLNPKPTINSYVHFPESETLWKSVGLDWPFRFVGKTLASLDETVVESMALAQCMQESAFTWHIKPGGEGFGHILFNSFAVGRPVITNFADYKGTAGAALLKDGVTAINTNGRTPQDLHQQLEWAASLGVHANLCQATYDRFQNVVNFDNDAKKVRQFLEMLV